MQATLLYASSVVIFLWGVGHVVPTRNVVAGFGPLSRDNGRIITMEWLAEGLTLCFIGVIVSLTVLVFGPGAPAAHLTARAAGVMLFVLAVVSAFTGARTAVLPMKLCPFVKTAVGITYWAATFLF